MQISAAFLCDFAEVREGLLMALGGGITRLWRQEYPASMGSTLALLVDLEQAELNIPHDISVRLQGADEPVGEIQGGFQTDGVSGLQPGEAVVAPIAIDLRPIQLPAEGSYSLNISIDGEFIQAVSFVAQPAGARPT